MTQLRPRDVLAQHLDPTEVLGDERLPIRDQPKVNRLAR